jgi:transcriptional regulator with XRE-family HTH domain
MPRKPRAHPKPERKPTFIRAWRKDRGLTLAALADQLQTLHGIEISEGQLSRIENGKSPYAQDLLEAIANVLRTEPASLIMRDPSRTEFWSVYDTLDPIQRKQVVEYADFIKRKAG